MASTFLTHNTTFTYLPGAHSIKTILSWSADDPYAITISLTTKRLARDWLVSRDLLLAALNGPVGLGDVSVFPDIRDDRRLELVISSPDGKAGFRMSRRSLTTFLNATMRVVPVGAEVMPASWLAEVGRES
jgi:sporulation and cell division protein SsgA